MGAETCAARTPPATSPRFSRTLRAGRTRGRQCSRTGRTWAHVPVSAGPAGALAPGASTLNVRPGQGLRLEIVNSAAIRFMRLRLTDNSGTLVPLIRVGGEGGLLDHAVEEGGVQPGGFDPKYDHGEIMLPPGSRADVVAAIPAAATGVLTMWTEDYLRSGPGPHVFLHRHPDRPGDASERQRYPSVARVLDRGRDGAARGDRQPGAGARSGDRHLSRSRDVHSGEARHRPGDPGDHVLEHGRARGLDRHQRGQGLARHPQLRDGRASRVRTIRQGRRHASALGLE